MFLNIRPFSPKKDGYYYPKYSYPKYSYPKYSYPNNTLLRFDKTEYNRDSINNSRDNQQLSQNTTNKIVRNILNNHSLCNGRLYSLSGYYTSQLKNTLLGDNNNPCSPCSPCNPCSPCSPYISTLFLATSVIFFTYVVSNKYKINFFKVL